jgi:hypothetical protein
MLVLGSVIGAGGKEKYGNMEYGMTVEEKILLEGRSAQKVVMNHIMGEL